MSYGKSSITGARQARTAIAIKLGVHAIIKPSEIAVTTLINASLRRGGCAYPCCIGRSRHEPVQTVPVMPGGGPVGTLPLGENRRRNADPILPMTLLNMRHRGARHPGTSVPKNVRVILGWLVSKETQMRAMLLTLIGAAALAGAIQPTMAQSPYTYPYCLQFIGGPISCYYANLQLCLAARFDRGGFCVRNPFRTPSGFRAEVPTRSRLH
jgi:hypothetical protein